MRRALALASFASLAAASTACRPQNATLIDGDFTAFLSTSTSNTLIKERLDEDGFARNYAVDCRDFDSATTTEETEALRLSGRIAVCPGDVRDDGTVVAANEWPPAQETWLDRDGFRVLGDTLDPYRGEGIITSEGDNQITFHQRLPGGEDFRFGFVIDPEFQPRVCVGDADGTNFEAIDGDWVDNWSADLADGSTLYFLTASDFQFDPDNLGNASASPEQWFFPREWRSGYARGKFSDDEFLLRENFYADPAAQLLSQSGDLSADPSIDRIDLYFCRMQAGTDPDAAVCLDSVFNPTLPSSMDEMAALVNTAIDEIDADLANVGVPGTGADAGADGLPAATPRIHENRWRISDGNNPGLDGWMSVNYNWVIFDEGSGFDDGDDASGSFNLVFDPIDSQSRFFVRGTFEVTWKDDKWTVPFLPDIKFEENGTELCE